MKKMLLLVAAIYGFSAYSQVGNYGVGDVVNNFTVTDTKGNVHNLYDITASGKHVLLDFFFTTCPPCQQTQPFYNGLYDKYGCNEGELYTISISGHSGDNNANVDVFEATYGGSYNHSPAVSPEGNGAGVVLDFGISAFPTYCLIGPDNKLINGDIWPITSVSSFESAFPAGFNPPVMACSVLGVDGLELVDVSVFPTVTSGEVKISLPENSNFQVSIVDLNGREVFVNQYNSTNQATLNLNLVPNVYMVTINVDNASPVVKRIVVQ